MKTLKVPRFAVVRKQPGKVPAAAAAGPAWLGGVLAARAAKQEPSGQDPAAAAGG